jgi:hypothetical protein
MFYRMNDVYTRIVVCCYRGRVIIHHSLSTEHIAFSTEYTLLTTIVILI